MIPEGTDYWKKTHATVIVDAHHARFAARISAAGILVFINSRILDGIPRCRRQLRHQYME
jgi:hypothetical protein